MKTLFSLFGLALAGVLLPLSGASAASPTHQRALIILNDTPYDLIEFDVWMVGYGAMENTVPYEDSVSAVRNPVIGGVAAHRAVTAYIEDSECFVHVSANSPEGRLFSADLDICRGPAIWIVQSDVPL